MSARNPRALTERQALGRRIRAHRGRGPVPYLDIELLYAALERERLLRRISARELLRQAGVDGASTWTRMSRGGAPNADNLVRLLSWLGTTDLQTFMGWVSR